MDELISDGGAPGSHGAQCWQVTALIVFVSVVV